MSEPMKRYRVCGSQPVHVRGVSVNPNDPPVMMTDKEAAFPLSIGAIEPATDAPGAEPFNTMAPAAEKKE